MCIHLHLRVNMTWRCGVLFGVRDDLMCDFGKRNERLHISKHEPLNFYGLTSEWPHHTLMWIALNGCEGHICFIKASTGTVRFRYCHAAVLIGWAVTANVPCNVYSRPCTDVYLLSHFKRLSQKDFLIGKALGTFSWRSYPYVFP